jgi:hypothetical protein
VTSTVARPASRAVPRSPVRFTSLAELVKFAVVAAVLAMLFDAVIGHALLWDNDPYWTYWVTDTFLIITVFSVGTALLGAGIARGAVITVVQMLVLTTYYWSLSPIGLPSSAEWLDLEHTWLTGPPVHFGVYYLGYLVALWLWRRRVAVGDAARSEVAADVVRALVTAGGIVAVVGAAQTVALDEFPGVTWFVMRMVILVPFTLGWWALAGRDRAASVSGGLLAAFLLAAYGHYLAPVGLPDADLRVLAQDPPPADVHWLSYRHEFLVMGPILLVAAIAAYLGAARWRGERWTPLALSPASLGAAALALVLVVAAGFVAAGHVGPSDERVTVTSSGDARVESGPDYTGDLVAAEADLRFVLDQRNTKRTPLPPYDDVDLAATITRDGTRYDVTAAEPMVRDAAGRFGTWGGVGYDRWHHGRSGEGTAQLDAVRSEVALYALGELRADGKLVATGLPLHALTTGAGVELHVGDPATLVPALPDGHLRVVWDERSGDSPGAPERARYLLGGVVLLALLALALTAARAEGRRRM